MPAAQAAGDLGVDDLLQLGAGAETRDARGLDLNRLARLRVAALTGASGGDVELAEPGEGDLPSAGELLLDRLERGLHCLLCVLAAEIGLLGDLFGQLGLVHG